MRFALFRSGNMKITLDKEEPEMNLLKVVNKILKEKVDCWFESIAKEILYVYKCGAA